MGSSSLTIRWVEPEKAHVCVDFTDVESRIRTLAAKSWDPSLMVEVGVPPFLVMMGLFSQEMSLTIMELRAEGGGREWISVGNVNRSDELECAFTGGEPSYPEGRELIPFEKGLAALRELVAKGEIPKSVKWEINDF
jgi:immunity protein Imm1 of predicted polymorphic toxin system